MKRIDDIEAELDEWEGQAIEIQNKDPNCKSLSLKERDADMMARVKAAHDVEIKVLLKEIDSLKDQLRTTFDELTTEDERTKADHVEDRLEGLEQRLIEYQ